MEEKNIPIPVGSALLSLFLIQQHLLECERCRHAYHPACLGPSYPTRATRKRRHWVRDKATCLLVSSTSCHHTLDLLRPAFP